MNWRSYARRPIGLCTFSCVIAVGRVLKALRADFAGNFTRNFSQLLNNKIPGIYVTTKFCLNKLKNDKIMLSKRGRHKDD